MNRFQILKGFKPPKIELKNPSSSPWVGKPIYFHRFFGDKSKTQGLIRDVLGVSDNTGVYLKILFESPNELPGNSLCTIEGGVYLVVEIETFEGTGLYRGNILSKDL